MTRVRVVEVEVPGLPGRGVPAGGESGEVLGKASGDDFDTEWVAQTGGGGSFSSARFEFTPDTPGFTTGIDTGIVIPAGSIVMGAMSALYSTVAFNESNGLNARLSDTQADSLDMDPPGFSFVCDTVNSSNYTVVAGAGSYVGSGSGSGAFTQQPTFNNVVIVGSEVSLWLGFFNNDGDPPDSTEGEGVLCLAWYTPA